MAHILDQEFLDLKVGKRDQFTVHHMDPRPSIECLPNFLWPVHLTPPLHTHTHTHTQNCSVATGTYCVCNGPSNKIPLTCYHNPQYREREREREREGPTLPPSICLVSMTIVAGLCSQTILQKSSTVPDMGP